MKRISALILGLCLCVPVYAQWKDLFKFRKPTASFGKNLTNNVQKKVLQSSLPTSQIRRMVAAGNFSSRLIPSVLAAPEAPQLVRNEFLTICAHKTIQLQPEHATGALQLLRRNLLAHTNRLDMLRSNPSAMLDKSENVTRLGLEALGDVYGIGWFGSKEDAAALVKLYQTLIFTDMEPLAFTATARALLALNETRQLETLLEMAPRTDAYEGFVAFLWQEDLPVTIPEKMEKVIKQDVSPLREQMLQISKPALNLFNFSPAATARYLNGAKQIRAHRADAPAPKAAAKVPPATLQTPLSEAVKTLPEEPSLLLGEPSAAAPAAQADVQAPAQTVVPTFEENLRPNPITKRYPSGLQDEEQVLKDWMEYYRHGYFRPRDQIEAIRGMSAAKANNVMEYFYYMSLEEAERVILDPIRQTGRLPDFMYDDKLIAGTRRLPAGYYKNKFNENIKRFVELAEEDGSIYLHNVELKEMATAFEDYTFEQGFAYANSPAMSAGLRRNWRALVEEIERPGMRANRDLINELWRKPVDLGNGKTVSLAEYFTQTRRSAFFEEGSTPEFYLNSPKWVAWENERRNLAAEEYINRFGQQKRSWWDRVQDFFVLGRRDRYLTVEQFGNVMVDEWGKSFTTAGSGESTMLADAGSDPSCLTIKVNNFDKVGGVCQMSFSDGGYAGPVRAGYDGTSTVNRFEPVEFENVPVVAFDFETMAPRVMTLATVPYVKDLKKPDLDQLRAGTMVGDGLDMTRDLLSVERADAALHYIPHLKATIYPRARLAGREYLPQFLDGGGLGAYLALFTPDFFPLKKINRWRWIDGKLVLVPEYFVRKEIPALSGAIHRNHITFTGQIEDRAVDKK